MPLEDLPGVTEIPAKCRRFTGGIDCSDKQKWQISVQQQLTSENAQLGLGLAEEAPRHHDLDDLAGTWVDDPEFDRAIEAMDQVDPELWR